MYNIIFDDKGNRSFWYFLIPIRGFEAMNLNNPISTQMLFDALEIGEKNFCLTKARKEKVHSTAVRPASQEKVLNLFFLFLAFLSL